MADNQNNRDAAVPARVNEATVRALPSQWRDAAEFFKGDAGSDTRETLRACARELEAALAQQPAAVDRARFRKAPCYLCGYNGPGYYQPDTHPCAAKYHAAQQQRTTAREGER